jgi:hypothetical protein
MLITPNETEQNDLKPQVFIVLLNFFCNELIYLGFFWAFLEGSWVPPDIAYGIGKILFNPVSSSFQNLISCFV